MQAPSLIAQTLDSIEVANYASPTDYEIGAVEVTGGTFSDATAIKSIAGLKVGETIRIPGPEITRAVKALMRLRLFTDVQVKLTKTIDDVAFLEIAIEEQPRLSKYRYKGIQKKYHEDLNDRLEGVLNKGGIVNENVKRNATNKIKEFFEEKGFLDASVDITESPDSIRANAVLLTLDINRGPRLKIEELDFTGNVNVKDKKLRGLMKETRRKRRPFASSKFIVENYEADKEKLIDYYNTIGFRDARIKSDSLTRGKWLSLWRGEEAVVNIQIDLNEGDRYFFRDISFKGNYLYEDKQLKEVLGINKGDVYNKELLETRLSFSQDGRDISSLYLDDGYLFFNVDPIETAVQGDSIDLEIRINEGPQATVDNVVINGNDRTHENVIRRELRVRPGDKFSRSDLIRSQREIIALGFFNPETLGIQTPVNAERGTVDVVFDLEEKANDQLELSMGWGGRGFGLFGTVGVSFNNFSLRKAIEGGAWRPYPTGDAQRLSLRLQSNGPFFFSSTASFSEPWLGGKRPTSLNTSLNYNRLAGNITASGDRGTFQTYTISANVGTRLRWPDDNFLVSAGVRMQHYQLDEYLGTQALFVTDEGDRVSEGNYTNVALEFTLARTSVADPIFPRNGSNFSLQARFTPPYSTVFGRDVNEELSTQQRYRWVEYHRYRASAEWYKSLVGKLVVKTSVKMGFLAGYNNDLGLSPFERFTIGGAGINNSQIARFVGTEIISSRGYEVDEFENNNFAGTQTATALFNKFALELRYPISLNPSATFYVLGFVEGANAWRNFDDYNPFDLKRSAGGGIRVFLPMFGTLGFDYGVGFDKASSIGSFNNVSNLSDVFSNFGQLNIVLGFEPE
ncbi:MAG: outer membrane protein assembly factor BamA [Saprospiraceae bacterium]